MLEKFEVASMLRDRPAVAKDRSSHQDVAAVIKLRNALVHFKSEWEGDQTTHAKVTAVLRGKYRLDSGADPGFPSSWAGHSCTE